MDAATHQNDEGVVVLLDMKRLRLLWEFSARGTIAAVAEALRLTPSAVSQQLALLEREAGVPLLRRAGRTLELTAAGEALVGEAGQLLAGLEHAEAELHRVHDAVVGVVRVAVFQTVLHAFLPGVLRELRRQHPGLRLELAEYEPETALRETWLRSFDLVIAEQYPGHAPIHFAGLDRVPFASDPIRLALPSRPRAGDDASPLGIALNGVASLRDAAELPWVMEPADTASRHFAEQLCRSAGFEPYVQFETPDLSAHVRLVEEGNAVALLPGLVQIRHPRLRFVELEGRPHRTIFTAARVASETHPAVAAVRQAIVAEAQTMQESLQADIKT